jgi:WD40 repeat protein
MRGRSIYEVNREFLDAAACADRFDLEPELRERLAGYRQFVERNAHRLGPHPGALREVALAEAEDSPVRQDVLAGLPLRKPQRPWFRRLHCPATTRNPALIRTISVGEVVYCVALVERDGRPYALAGCSDGCLRLYDLATGQLAEPILRGHTGEVFAVALSLDGRRALSGSWDNTLHWWSLDTGACQEDTLEGHTSGVRALALSLDGRRALSGSDGGTLRWWDLQPRRRWDLQAGPCFATLKGHTSGVYAVALSLDARRALSGSHDRTLRWWDLGTGACLATLEGHASGVSAVALSGDGCRALSGSDDCTLRWWDLQAGRCLALFPCEEPVTSAALSGYPSEQCYRVVAGLADGQVQFFRIEEG